MSVSRDWRFAITCYTIGVAILVASMVYVLVCPI
jgi:hypothetical protein